MLAEYPASIVSLAADPRTGIAGRSKFLPAVAEVKEFCDAAQERQARIDRYAALPKFERRSAPRPVRTPNLFVPVGFHRYDNMADRDILEPGFCRFERAHVCADGVPRDGLWVPLEWWNGEEKAEQSAARETAPLVASPELLKTLEAQNEQTATD